MFDCSAGAAPPRENKNPSLLTRGTVRWWLAGLAVSLLATLPAWLPWLDPRLDFRALDDARNHLMRLYHLEWLIQRGVWYPRWLPDLFLGYGYPVFNYYAPGFYYVTLALRAALRLDLWDAFRAGGVAAALLGATGTYAFVVSLWHRAAPAALAAALVLYAPYAFQTNLFKRADLPEAMGLALIPWLLLTLWRTWTADTPTATPRWTPLPAASWDRTRDSPGGRYKTAWRWTAGAAVAGGAALLLHNLTALLAAAVAAAWVLTLTMIVPGGVPDAGAGRLRRRLVPLGRVALAGALALGSTAFFWLPAATEGDAVQLEWLHDGDLRYDDWLLDPAGGTRRQQSSYNRQTRSGPFDLHLLYPHGLVASPKLSLAQAGVAAAALAAPLLALALARRPSPRAPVATPLAPDAPPGDGPAARAAPLAAVLPFWTVAVVCWGMTFTPAAPLWAGIPGLTLLQFPWRLLGPLAVCLAVAVAGGLVPLLRALEARYGASGRRAGWALAGVLTLAVAVNGAGDRTIPLDDLDASARAVDATNVVLDERRDPKTVGTTSGREFLPRQVDVPLFSRGAFRYRDVMERLYPEADWLGGRLLPIAGEVRLVAWRSEPLRLTLRVVNDGAGPARLGVRQLDFPGWRAWLDGRPAPIEHAPRSAEQQAAPGFIVLSVPPGEHTLGLAFGPSGARLLGAALSLLTGLLLAGALLARRRTPLALRVASLLAVVLTLVIAWRAGRPLTSSWALMPLAEPGAPAGTWRAPDLDGAGNPRNGLLVNVAEAVRLDRAAVGSPTGAALGPDRFVDVRQLTVTDEDDPGRGVAGTSRRQWLYLHPPSTAAVDVALPAGRQTWLQAALALDPAVWGAPTGDGVRFTVTVAPLDAGGQPGAPVAVFDRAVNPRARTEERRWLPVEVDVSAWAGQTVRLTLRTDPRDDLTHDWAGWANPVLVVREQARAQPPSPE